MLQALATFGDEIAIAFSGAEDVAVIEYAHLTGRPFRVFRYSKQAFTMHQNCNLLPNSPGQLVAFCPMTSADAELGAAVAVRRALVSVPLQTHLRDESITSI